MTQKIVIGISGFARSGKDTLAQLLSEKLQQKNMSVKILSFAFSLKSDIDNFCKDKIGISSFTEHTESKSKIRPILIAYGACQRSISNGTYWLDKIKPEINSFFENGGNVAIIPDLRFKEYSFDEYDFVRSYQNNIVLTISKTLHDGNENPPAHESEANNFPFFIKNSDFNLNWETSNDKTYLNSKVNECLQHIYRKMNPL